MTTKKHKILDEFFAVTRRDKAKEEKAVETKIKEFIRDNGNDKQLADTLRLMKIQRTEKVSNDFLIHCSLSQPILERLYLAPNWDIYDLRILSMTGICIDNIPRINFFLEKYLDILDNTYKNEPFYNRAKIAMYTNITNTLLKMGAHYCKENTEMREEIAQMLNKFTQIVIEMAGDNEEFAVAKVFATMRKAIFEEDEDTINKSLTTVRKIATAEQHKLALNEIADYNFIVKNIINERPIKMQIATNIRKHRINAGFTIEQLAEKMGISSNTLSQIERVERSASLANLIKLKRILKKPVDEIIGDHEPHTDDERCLERKLLEDVVNLLPTESIRVLKEVAQLFAKR